MHLLLLARLGLWRIQGCALTGLTDLISVQVTEPRLHQIGSPRRSRSHDHPGFGCPHLRYPSTPLAMETVRRSFASGQGRLFACIDP